MYLSELARPAVKFQLPNLPLSGRELKMGLPTAGDSQSPIPGPIRTLDFSHMPDNEPMVSVGSCTCRTEIAMTTHELVKPNKVKSR